MEFINYKAELETLKLLLDFTDDFIEIVDEGMFLLKESRTAYRTIGAMSYYGKVTVRALQEKFQDDNNMTEHMQLIYKQDVTKDDIDHLIQSLRTAVMRHEAFQYAQDIIHMVKSENEEVQAFVENGKTLSMHGEKEELYENTFEATKDWYTNFMNECSNPDSRKRLQLLSMPQLNDAFGGIDELDFILFCAKSGHGKTTLALNLAKDFAIDQGKVVYYVNAEMSVDQLRERLMSNMTGIDAKEIDRRILTGTEQEKIQKHSDIADAVDIFAKKKLILSQVPTIYPSKVRKAVKQLTLNDMRPEVIFIDYIRHMDPEVSVRGMQEYQIMYECAEACKQLAKDLHIPVIALAQLNDSGVLEGSKKMRNAVDGLLFFKEIPRNADDVEDVREREKIEKEIQRELNSMSSSVRSKANYKIIKEKVRRGDPTNPIYMRYRKNVMKVNEVE